MATRDELGSGTTTAALYPPVIGANLLPYGDDNPVTSVSTLSAELAAMGTLSTTTYNTNGTLATYVADGIVWTVAYDSAGRISTETASTGTVRTYGYNATTGRLDSVTVA